MQAEQLSGGGSCVRSCDREEDLAGVVELQVKTYESLFLYISQIEKKLSE